MVLQSLCYFCVVLFSLVICVLISLRLAPVFAFSSHILHRGQCPRLKGMLVLHGAKVAVVSNHELPLPYKTVVLRYLHCDS